MWRATILLLCLSFVGCGGGGGTRPIGGGGGLDGAWEGVFYHPATTIYGTVDLTVNGSSVTGTTDPAGPQGNGSFSLDTVSNTGTANLPGIGNGAVTSEVYPETPAALRLVVIIYPPSGNPVSMSLKRP